MKTCLLLPHLLFLYKYVSPQEYTPLEHIKSLNGFQKLFENNSAVSIAQIQHGRHRGTINNPSHPTKDFLFIVATPKVIRPHSNFSIVIRLEESKSPVKFNLSILNNAKLLLPSKQTSLLSDTSEVIILSIKDIPREPTYRTEELEVVVSAESVGQDSPNSIQERPISLIVTQIPQKKIIIETNKNTYFPGEKIIYRIAVLDFLTRRPITSPKPLQIRFLNRERIPVWDEPVLVNTSSLGVYTGSAKVRKNIRSLTVSIPEEKVHEECFVNIGQTESSDFFRINLEAPRRIISYGTKLIVNISFLTAEESLPVDGTCEMQVNSDSLVYYDMSTFLLSKNITTSSGVRTKSIEFDFTKELDLRGFNYNETLLFLTTMTKCYHIPSGIHVGERTYTSFDVRKFWDAELLGAKIFPYDPNNNTAPIFISLKITKGGGLEEADYLKPLNVTFDIDKSHYLNDIEFDAGQQFVFDSIPSNGI